jgi:hypothetical protein
MRGAIPPLPNTSSWRGGLLSIGKTVPFTLPLLDGYNLEAETGHFIGLT